MTTTQMAYIGHASCGCVLMATLDTPTRAEQVADDLRDGVLAGLTIERVPVKQAQLGPCAWHRPPPTPAPEQKELPL